MSAIGTLALLIEFGGALVIAFHVAHAAWLALLQRQASLAAAVAGHGLVAGLDFKLAATLLKTLTLVSWNQIAMFAAILALRTLVKKTLVTHVVPRRSPSRPQPGA
ncbi:MAG: DUF1622 domain-containing protein [Massilia sp.]